MLAHTVLNLPGSRIFNFQKAYSVLDELIIAGELQESSKKSVLRVVSKPFQETRGQRHRGKFVLYPLLSLSLLTFPMPPETLPTPL